MLADGLRQPISTGLGELLRVAQPVDRTSRVENDRSGNDRTCQRPTTGLVHTADDAGIEGQCEPALHSVARGESLRAQAVGCAGHQPAPVRCSRIDSRACAAREAVSQRRLSCNSAKRS